MCSSLQTVSLDQSPALAYGERRYLDGSSHDSIINEVLLHTVIGRKRADVVFRSGSIRPEREFLDTPGNSGTNARDVKFDP